MEPAPSATPARFSGPVCDFLDNNVIICTKTLNSACFLFSRQQAFEKHVQFASANAKQMLVSFAFA